MHVSVTAPRYNVGMGDVRGPVDPLVASYLLNPARPPEALGLAILEQALYLPSIMLEGPAPTGAGAYLLIYVGAHDLYRPLTEAGWPMYIGSSPRLRGRLARHRDSIRQLRDLDVADWRVVCLEVPARGEALLVECHLQTVCAPVWNSVVTGLGTRAPGAGRPGVRGRLTALDVLHGPRVWADGEIDEVEKRRLRRRVREHITGAGAPFGAWPCISAGARIPAPRRGR